jgi:hypothetical protein
MFDLGRMAQSPEARQQMMESFFQLLSRQASQSPPDLRKALTSTEVVITRTSTGFSVGFADSDHPQVRQVAADAIDHWSEFLARGFNAAGFKVKVRRGV